MRFLILAFALTLIGSHPLVAQDRIRLEPGQRVLFLGDSNTFAGGFINYLDAYLLLRHPGKTFELINLGLPSETVSGLSEPDHPYPRPNIHERLDRALEKIKPNLVVACYGMNDGIYYPFSKERLAKFQEGYRTLIDRLQRDKIPLIILTPMPFDAPAVKTKLLPKGAEKYSWMKPYEDYDYVLARYSEWLREMKKPAGVQVVDVHGEATEIMQHLRAHVDKKFILSGDGIHPGPLGHLLAAGALGRELGLFAPEPAGEIDLKEGKAATGDATARLNMEDVSIAWQMGLALPSDPAWKFTARNNATVRALSQGPTLKVLNLPWKTVNLYEGTTSLGTVEPNKDGTFTLMPYAFKNFSRRKDSEAFWKLVQARQKLLGLAWLTDVGHKRPDTPKGIALEDALKKAMEMTTQLRDLSRPRKIELRLTSKKK